MKHKIKHKEEERMEEKIHPGIHKKIEKKIKKKKHKKAADKVKKVMHEYKAGELHSGSKNGPVVTNPRQAIAIALSEKRRAKKNK